MENPNLAQIMYKPPYPLIHPDHLPVFEEAFHALPSDIYEYFVNGYAYYLFEEKMKTSADQEVEVMRLIIETSGDIRLAMKNYQARTNVITPTEGLSPIFRMYIDDLRPNERSNPRPIASAPTPEESLPSQPDIYSPHTFINSELISTALDGLPKGVYDLLIPKYLEAQADYFGLEEAIESLVNAKGNVEAAIESANRFLAHFHHVTSRVPRALEALLHLKEALLSRP